MDAHRGIDPSGSTPGEAATGGTTVLVTSADASGPGARRWPLPLRLVVVAAMSLFALGFAGGEVAAAVGQATAGDPSATTAPPATVPSTTAPPVTTVKPPAPRPAPKPPAPAPPAPRPAPAPDPAAKQLSHLHVSLGTQHVNAIARDGSLLWSFAMSSGSNGRTPPGTYHVYSRSASTRATSDLSVTMQYMTRFNGGIGFHALPRKNGRVLYTPLGIRPVSHGCVRLADHHARWIYATIPTGTRVVVK